MSKSACAVSVFPCDFTGNDIESVEGINYRDAYNLFLQRDDARAFTYVRATETMFLKSCARSFAHNEDLGVLSGLKHPSNVVLEFDTDYQGGDTSTREDVPLDVALQEFANNNGADTFTWTNEDKMWYKRGAPERSDNEACISGFKSGPTHTVSTYPCDFVGNDIGDPVEGLTYGEAYTLFLNTDDAVAFTYVRDNQTLFLKSAAENYSHNEDLNVISGLKHPSNIFLEFDSDYMGADIEDTGGVSLNDALEEFAGRDDAMTFTWCQREDGATMYHKESIPERSNNDTCISGFRITEGTAVNVSTFPCDFMGNDIESVGDLNYNDAYNIFLQRADATAFTYVRESKTLFLKNSASGYAPSDQDLISGIKHPSNVVLEFNTDYMGADMDADENQPLDVALQRFVDRRDTKVFTWCQREDGATMYNKHSVPERSDNETCVSGFRTDIATKVSTFPCDFMGNDIDAVEGLHYRDAYNLFLQREDAVAFTYVRDNQMLYLKSAAGNYQKNEELNLISGLKHPSNVVLEFFTDYQGGDIGDEETTLDVGLQNYSENEDAGSFTWANFEEGPKMFYKEYVPERSDNDICISGFHVSG